MTSADAPYRRASAVARGWRTFRRWRRGRPFWGGVITILSGVVFFLSGHITFGGIKISFGPEEFLGWVIPLLLVLCGLLMLLTPAQRIFYGVLAAAISVGGLLGLNLGGFIVGMLLGMVGGALGASWAPVQLPPDAGTPPAADGPLPADEEDEPVEEPEEPESYPLSGLLGDTLPTSTTSPLGVPPVEAPEPGGRLPRRSPRGLAVILLVVATAAGLGLGMVRTAWPASAAETCGATPAAAAAATKPATTRAPSRAAAAAPTTPAAAPTTPAAAAASSAVPTSSPTSSAGGGTALGDTVRNLVSDVVDGVGKLLGIGDQPDPSATPSTTAPADPAPTTTSPASGASPTPTPPAADPTPAPRSPTAAPKPTSKSTPTRSPSPSPTCLTAKALAAPADNTKAAVNPATQITAVLEQVNLTFDGVTSLPTANGSIRVLQFSMDSSTSTPFELRVPVNDHTLDYRSSKLTVSGHVRFYTSELDIAGIPVLTPDSDLTALLQLLPPGVTLPVLVFPAVTLKLVLVRADKLTAPDLTIAYL